MMIHIGPQYYRAPFPEERFWKEDMKKMKDSGLNCVQFWVLWGWVESRPGEYNFSDYDRLMDLAEEAGLKVVISTIAAIHPYWIHREIPGSEMIDHMGGKVVSSNRGECHFGLTPGGCFDHPEVLKRMLNFIRVVAERYAGRNHVVGWDAWNELRWNVQSDGYVCYCENTLREFREWLMQRFGSLDELNRIWRRRYGQLDEIQPGKLHTRPFTEMTAFQHFLTWRSNRHGRQRYEVIKSIDSRRPVTVHASTPCALFGGDMKDFNQALNRGNDWFFADDFDGFGCSNFPLWGKEDVRDDAAYALHMDLIRSAAQGKHLWVSELQGGRVGSCQQEYAQVRGAVQQRWVWNAIANGVEKILFWCWRDEVFGSESSGFGIIGNDGFADERIKCLQKTGKLLAKHEDLLAGYRPETPQVGVLFSPQSYYLYAAQDGEARRAVSGLRGICTALIRSSIPYTVVEEEHLDALKGIKLLFLPRVVVMDDELAKQLKRFVNDGGVLVADCESGAWDSQGIYRYPGERWLDEIVDGREKGRRNLPENPVRVRVGGKSFKLSPHEYSSPWVLNHSEIQAKNDDGILIADTVAGKGRVITWGTYFANAYDEDWNPEFEDYLVALAESAGVRAPAEALDKSRKNRQDFVLCKSGLSGDAKLLFVFLPPGCTRAQIRLSPDFIESLGTVRELLEDKTVECQKSGDTMILDTGELPWSIGVFCRRDEE